MKKTALRLLSALMALILALSLGGCALLARGPAADPTPAPQPTEKPTPEPASTEEPTPVPQVDTTGLYASVNEFIADNRATLDAAIGQMLGDQQELTASIEGTTDTLIYKFVFSDAAMEGVDEQALIEALEESVDDQEFKDTFVEIANSVKEAVSVDTVYVDVIYARADGVGLVTRTYASTAPASAPASTGTAGATVTVRDCLEANRASIEGSLESIVTESDEIADLKLDATDDTLIYKFILDDDAISGIDDSTLTASLNAALNEESMADYFSSNVAVIKSYTTLDSVTVRLVYVKSDGTVLTSKDYTSK